MGKKDKSANCHIKNKTVTNNANMQKICGKHSKRKLKKQKENHLKETMKKMKDLKFKEHNEIQSLEKDCNESSDYFDSDSEEYISQFNAMSKQKLKSDSSEYKIKFDSHDLVNGSVSEDSDQHSGSDVTYSDMEDGQTSSLNIEEGEDSENEAHYKEGPNTDSDSDSLSDKREERKIVKTVKDEYAQLRKELEDMPFEEIQKLQERVGMKVYSQVFGNLQEERRRQGKTVYKRANKNRPMEMSSKKPVKIFREVVSTKKKVVRDPRFDDLSGKFDEHIFKNSYHFLSDLKQTEKQKLMKKLKKEKDVNKKQELEYLIQRMTNQERAEKEKEARKDRERSIRKQEHEMVMAGKKPFYMKKSEKRKLELSEKFKELKKSGKIDNYLGKKRKKNASKDRKRLPFRVDH